MLIQDQAGGLSPEDIRISHTPMLELTAVSLVIIIIFIEIVMKRERKEANQT